MPIIANNVIVTSQQKNEPVVEPIINENKRKIKRPPPPVEYNSNDTVLVVNGKPKKISKKSQYLLDMLNLEEE